MIFGKKKETAQRDLVIAYKRVFGTMEGKQVLSHILNHCHILSTHKGDPFSEGKRAAALMILSNCNIDLSEFDKLLKGELNDFNE